METRKDNTILSARQIFILCAEEDKEYVLALQSNLKARKLEVWSMFKDNGNYAVGIGDDHLQVAIGELKKTCVVLLLISEHSIKKGAEKSSFIFQEINNFYNLTTSRKNYAMKLVPICIGDDYFNCLPESWMPLGINSFKISTTLKMKNTPSGDKVDEIKLNHICNEVSNIYYECMNANHKFILDNKYNLVALGNKLMQSEETIVKTISDDIRQTDENDSDSLRAIHIITNEINEYDCNAYALMIISSNLLGELEDGHYQPEKNGIKYYYYCPRKYLETHEEDYRHRIISFLRRDKDAIERVDNSVRAQYVAGKRIIPYLFEMFVRKSASNFLSIFSVPDKEKEKFKELLEQYDGDCYDSDSETIALPPVFFDWLFGRKPKAKVNIRTLEFISDVVEFLKNTSVHNETRLNELITIENMLDKLYSFHVYMRGVKDKMTFNKFRSIAKKVIGLKNDQNNTLIERWVIDREESDEWEDQDMDEVISQAMKNVVFIPIKESDDFVPCNSFAVFDHKDKVTGKTSQELVWYSTAQNKVQSTGGPRHDEQEMVVILNEETTDEDCDVIRNTLKYLKALNLIENYYEF